MEPIWRNTPLLTGLILVLLAVVGLVYLWDEGYLDQREPEVFVEYDTTTDEIFTHVEIRLKNVTDEIRLIDGEGFRIGDRKLMGESNNVLIPPYGEKRIELYCVGWPEGPITYIHEDHVPMDIVHDPDIIPDE